MGRYLALGVVSKIDINPRNGFDFEKNKKLIEKELGRYLNLSKYNWNKEKNGFHLSIKTEHFNKNIHELIRELYPFIDCEYFYSCHWTKKIDVLKEDFNSKNYPIVLKQAKEHEENYQAGAFYCEWNGMDEEWAMEAPELWIFKDKNLRGHIGINFCYIPLWIAPSKILLEDDTELLGILNMYHYSYYKNPLAKNILFYIAG